MSNVDDLLRKRRETHGDTWLIAGDIMHLIGLDRFALLFQTPYTHNWVLILSKLIRILFSPMHKDHWADIEGYAKLVVDNLASKKENTEHGKVQSD
jgi:ribonuclease BN (tRNA processing enzyme)